MNIYNLQDFKCPFCSKWFHPKKSIPLALACGHSICSSCLQKTRNNLKTIKVVCPHHGILQQSKSLQINEHIQAALQRLLKNHSNSGDYDFDEKSKRLTQIIKKKQQDSIALIQLLQRIYTIEINRITCLRNRILKELRDPYNCLEQWKKMCEYSKNYSQLEEQEKKVKDIVQRYQKLDLQKIANRIIQQPSICFLRNFSIENLVQEEKKVVRSIKRQSHHKRKSTISSDYPQNKENIYLNQVKIIESPMISPPNTQNDCKLLTTFKIEQSRSDKKNRQKDIPNKQFRNSSPNFLDTDTNDDTIIRQFDQSKCSFKQKYLPVQNQIRFSDQILDITSSLNRPFILDYSEDLQGIKEDQDEMLLSGYKNFMQNVDIQQKKTIKDVQTRQRVIINSQKQQDKFIKIMQKKLTEQAYSKTKVINNTFQLINIDLKNLNWSKFLDKFNWKEIQTIKFVGTGMLNEHLNILLNYIINSKVQALILPNNQLQSISLDALIRFSELNHYLKRVSLQKNPIHQTQGKTKTKISILKNKGIQVYF